MSSIPLDSLPDDVAALKALVATQAHLIERQEQSIARHERGLAQNEATITRRDERIERLNETIRKLLAHRFGRSAENAGALDADQPGLFDEAELDVPPAGVADDAADGEGTEVQGHRRGKRKPLPTYLPRIDVLHDLPEAQRVCPHDGNTLQRIGEDISEQLDIVPMKVQVLRHIRAKYACPSCDRHIALADRAPQLIPKSLASEGLLAFVATSKYVDGLPLNRIAQQLARIGVQTPRQTMAGWMIAVGERVMPLVERCAQILQAGTVMQMDETEVRVLAEPGRTPSAKSYMWVRTGGDERGMPI